MNRLGLARTMLLLVAASFAMLGFVPLANLLTHGGAVPWWSLAQREWLERGLVVSAVATLTAVVLRERLDEAFLQARQTLLRLRPHEFAVTIGVIAAAAAAFFARFCFAGQPFTTDEMAQQWHARILLSGHVFAVPEPWREFFNTAPVFDRDGRWFSQYPVGGPAFVAAGMAVGLAWLVNPLLLGFATWNLYRFLAVAFDELTARTTTLLFVVSPMVLIMSASQMNHVPALAFTMLALASLAQWDCANDSRSRLQAAIALGLAVGIVALARPLDGVVLAVLVGLFQVSRLRKEPMRAKSVMAQVLAGTVPVGLMLWANALTTGHALTFGYDALNGSAHALGFHEDPAGQLHTPGRGLTYVSGYLMRLSRYLFEWPIPGMLFVVAGLLGIRRPSRWDVLLAGLVVVITAVYGAYWFDGFFAGPRFLFTAIPAFVYFAARGPGATVERVRSPLVRRAVLLLVPLCVLTAWLGPTGVSSARARVALYRDQRTKLKTDIDAQIARAGLRNALVFVNDGWRARLLARLRVLGMSQFRADRVLNTLDACALQSAIDAGSAMSDGADEDRLSRVLASARAWGEARIDPGLQSDQAIALVPGKPLAARCVEELRRDSAGTIPFPLFLGRQNVEPNRRVGGDVVFARDLGEHNRLLRERFGTRTWFRYRPPRDFGDTARAFAPY